MPLKPHLAASEIPLYEGDLDRDLLIVPRVRLADEITGGLAQTSNLPCSLWDMPSRAVVMVGRDMLGMDERRKSEESLCVG